MAKTNLAVKSEYTHGGAKASHINPEQLLRRSVMSCMLWEHEFYEDGETIADRIRRLIALVKPQKVSAIAVEARTKMHLRHVPLLIVREMAKLPEHKKLVAQTLSQVVQRTDELAEFLALYWKDGRQYVSHQVQKGLARAFTKFNEYSLAKYNRDGQVKLKDVLFLCHAKPKDDEQDDLWKRLIKGELKTPDTWEVELSKNPDKKQAWTRLVSEKKLGGMAILRNLRNMQEADLPLDLIKSGLSEANFDRVLPFRFLSAARHAPKLESEIETAMFKAVSNRRKLSGKTILVLDISGSMGAALSSKSDLNRLDAACALGVLARETCEEPVIYATAGDDYRRVHATDIVPSRRGFALIDAIKQKNSTLGGGGIFLSQCLDYIFQKEKIADRVIVFTDEQDCDNKLSPDKANAFGNKNYIINIASAKNGIAYSKFTHINGFSEAVLDYIECSESSLGDN